MKVGAGYAIEILRQATVNGPLAEMSDEAQASAEMTRLDTFVGRTMAATSGADVIQVIDDFKATVVDRYFTRTDGQLSL